MEQSNYEYIQSIRDEITPSILVKADSVASTLNVHDIMYPHHISTVQLDMIDGENFKDLRHELRKFSIKISSKVKDTVPIDTEFKQHKGFKHTHKSEMINYIPMTLEFDDGQVLMALARTYGEDKDKPNKQAYHKVVKWFLNEEDLSKKLFKTRTDMFDDSKIAKRIAGIINQYHTAFVKENAKDNTEILELEQELATLEAEEKDLIAQVEAQEIQKQEQEKAKQLELEQEQVSKEMLAKELTAELQQYNTSLEITPTEDFKEFQVTETEDDKKLVKTGNEQDMRDFINEAKDIAERIKAEEQTAKATIDFNTNEQAEEFATAYSRKTMRGHTVAGNKVSVYGLSEDDKKWIDEYVKNINEPKIEIPTPTKNVISGVKNSLATIYGIDTGKEKGYDRKLFVSSIVNKIKTQAKNQNDEVVIETVDYIEAMNNWAKSQGSKQLISDRSPIWDLRLEAQRRGAKDEEPSTDTEEDLGIIALNIQNKVIGGLYPEKPYTSKDITLKIEQEIDKIIGKEGTPTKLQSIVSKDREALLTKVYNMIDEQGYITKEEPSEKVVDVVEQSRIQLEKLKNHKTYIQILKDSHNGVMFDNSKKYENMNEIADLWNSIEFKDVADGTVSSVMGWVLSKIEEEPTTPVETDYTSKFEDLMKIDNSQDLEVELDKLADELEASGKIEEFEDDLNKVADKLTELMKQENE